MYKYTGRLDKKTTPPHEHTTLGKVYDGQQQTVQEFSKDK